MPRESSLTEQRLRLIYTGEGFGGDNTMRAKVIRELIDEIHALREELRGVGSTALSPAPGSTPASQADRSDSSGASSV